MPQLFVSITPRNGQVYQYNFESNEDRHAFIFELHPTEVYWYYFPEDDFGSVGALSWSNPAAGGWHKGPAWPAEPARTRRPKPAAEDDEGDDRW
jgi:hypothetical protein